MGNLTDLIDDVVDRVWIVSNHLGVEIDLVDIALGLFVDRVVADDEAVAVAVLLVFGQDLSAEPGAYLGSGRMSIVNGRSMVCGGGDER